MFVVGRISYLHYVCLFAYSGVQHILCYVFVLFFFVLCSLCGQFLWIVPLCWLSLRYSLTFISNGAQNVKTHNRPTQKTKIINNIDNTTKPERRVSSKIRSLNNNVAGYRFIRFLSPLYIYTNNKKIILHHKMADTLHNTPTGPVNTPS